MTKQGILEKNIDFMKMKMTDIFRSDRWAKLHCIKFVCNLAGHGQRSLLKMYFEAYETLSS